MALRLIRENNYQKKKKKKIRKAFVYSLVVEGQLKVTFIIISSEQYLINSFHKLYCN